MWNLEEAVAYYQKMGAPRDQSALVELLRGGFGGLLGGGNCGCSEDHMINRYEAAQQAKISELETEVKLRDANTFAMERINAVRDYVDRRLECVNASISSQAVINAQVAANLSCLTNTVNTLSGLTKTVIPITAVCPEPMPQYNSWTAPTAGA